MNSANNTMPPAGHVIDSGNRIKVIVSLVIITIAILCGWFVRHKYFTDVAPIASHNTGDIDESTSPASSTIKLSTEQWNAANIEVQPVTRSTSTRTVKLTGKVTLNEDKIAHIYPLVEGAVDTVHCTLGQDVKKDDLLLTIHSREIGTTKLELYQARQELEVAKFNQTLQRDIINNTKELIYALRKNQSINSIEESFRDRTMGDYRQRLLDAYSQYLKSDADLERLKGIVNTGAIASKQLLAAETNRNADLASYQARIEQIAYELTTLELATEQAVKRAETKVAVIATNLKILGLQGEEIDQIDPATQGEALSHYVIRAPFDGTVIAKDAALQERVQPDVQLLSVADLATVWIAADVYEENVPLLNELADQEISVFNEAWPDETFKAKIFYTGEIMDVTTRTISLRAVAANDRHLLKPGMFVTIELPSGTEDSTMKLPVAAVQEFEGKKFVFVQVNDLEFKRCDVQIGETLKDMVVVLEGLDEGDTVAVKGSFVLKSLLLEELMAEE